MFKLRIHDRKNALVVSERDPEALKMALVELANSPELYQKLSEAGGDAAEGYLCPLKYHDVITAFLTLSGRQEAKKFSLTNYKYV